MSYVIYESAMTPEITGVKKGAKGLEFITTLQEADVKNRNGRIYPKSVIDNAIRSPLIQEHLRKHDLFGEAGHPMSQDVSRQTQIDLRNIAFRINEMWWEGNLLKGRCETLNTALGRDMAGLIEQGVLVSFSLRAQGNVIRDNLREANVVQDPLMMVTFDWVALPSHQPAYLERICEETKFSMFHTDDFSSTSIALCESLDMYENGKLNEVNAKEVIVEKPTIDYYSTYSSSAKLLSEVYQYNPNDTLIEMTDRYVLLENANNKIKVAKEDYLTKSIRYSILESKSNESCAGIAALDCPRSTEPLEKQEPMKDIKSEDVLQTLASGEDVVPSEEYKNPMQVEVEKKLGEKPQNVSADTLKEEFRKYYNIIAEETGLTKKKDIIAMGVKYSQYLPESCARLFSELAKEEE